MVKLKTTFFILVVLFCMGFRTSNKWETINEVNYFGFKNPLKNSDSKFVIGDLNELRVLLHHAESCEEYFAKGASRYAVFYFKNGSSQNVQLLAGKPGVFYITNASKFEKKWFKIKGNKANEQWYAYWEHLELELKKMDY